MILGILEILEILGILELGVYKRLQISFNSIFPIHTRRHGVRQEQEEMNLKKKSVTKYSIPCVKLHPL